MLRKYAGCRCAAYDKFFAVVILRSDCQNWVFDGWLLVDTSLTVVWMSAQELAVSTSNHQRSP